MNRQQKVRTVDELKEAMTKCSVAVLTNYQGLSASEMVVLRRRLRQLGIEYRVVKNTLARFAAEKAGKDFLAGSFEGPVAVALGYGDITEPARALLDYIRSSNSTLAIRGGFLGDRLLTSQDVNTLATVASREVLLAQLLAGMQGPIVALLNCLANPLRDVIGILQARIKQLEVK
ncbi:MAG: 50S ribosomal protein L10 [Dehalococcoidales bacterium]